MKFIARAPIELRGRSIRPGDTFESDTWDESDTRAEPVIESHEDSGEAQDEVSPYHHRRHKGK